MIVLLFAAGCSGGDGYAYSGYTMSNFFPFDGERTWTFQSEDPNETSTVVATLNSTPEVIDDGQTSIFDVNYTMGCLDDAVGCTPGDWRLKTIRWSSSSGEGVQIHGFDDGSGLVAFNPPIALTGKDGVPDDVWTTETDAGTFVSTFDQIGDCPVYMAVDWDQCIKLSLDDDGDPATPGTHALHGDYYAVASFNVIAILGADDDAMWKLLDTTLTYPE